MMTVIVLAAFGAVVATAQAENQTPSPQNLSTDFTHPEPVGRFSQLPATCTGYTVRSSCEASGQRWRSGFVFLRRHRHFVADVGAVNPAGVLQNRPRF
jgi:hypothetical protein